MATSGSSKVRMSIQSCMLLLIQLAGIAYQLIEDDPLINTEQCQRDASLMQQLGANAIRVYHVDASADHTGCMNAFAAVGIYLFVDLDSFKTYIRYVSACHDRNSQKLTAPRVMNLLGRRTSRTRTGLSSTIFSNMTIQLDSLSATRS
jgi:hypothetical protein